MPTSRNVIIVSHIDCPGGGQVWIDGNTLFVAHMRAPAGTSIYDVADPRAPRRLAHVEIPAGWHSHKVRAQDGVMVVNHERHGDGGDGRSFATSSSATTMMARPLSFPGIGRHVWVGCGCAGPELSPDTRRGFARSDTSRMKKPWCQ